MYGLTEFWHVNVPALDEMIKNPALTGSITINNEVKIVDDEGMIVPYNEKGEIWVRGPCMFIEYVGQPELTRSAKTEDGWFKTGLVGYCMLYIYNYIWIYN